MEWSTSLDVPWLPRMPWIFSYLCLALDHWFLECPLYGIYTVQPFSSPIRARFHLIEVTTGRRKVHRLERHRLHGNPIKSSNDCLLFLLFQPLHFRSHVPLHARLQKNSSLNLNSYLCNHYVQNRSSRFNFRDFRLLCVSFFFIFFFLEEFNSLFLSNRQFKKKLLIHSK